MNISSIPINPNLNPGESSQTQEVGNSTGLESFVKHQFFIRSLNPGDVFKGQVTNIVRDMVTISVDGEQVSAKLDQQVTFTIGAGISFLVKEKNGNQIVLSPVTEIFPSTKEDALYRALEAADFPISDRNLDAAEALFDHQMPLNKQGITGILDAMYRFPDVSPNILALMLKNKISLTSETVGFMKQYLTNGHSITSDLTEILSGLSKQMNLLGETKSYEKGKEFIRNVLQLEELPKQLLKLSDKEWEHLLKNPVFHKRLEDELIQKWTLEPEKLNNESLKKLYERLENQAGNIEQHFIKEKGADSSASLKTHLQFMNELNQNYIYTQIPLQMKNQLANAELYVYRNRKRSKTSKEETSVLLHFSMEYLGGIDIYIKMHMNSVHAKFTMESKDGLFLMEKNIEQLKQSLSQKGFSFSYETEQKEQTRPDFEDDFLERETPKLKLSKYSFDIRT